MSRNSDPGSREKVRWSHDRNHRTRYVVVHLLGLIFASSLTTGHCVETVPFESEHALVFELQNERFEEDELQEFLSDAESLALDVIVRLASLDEMQDSDFSNQTPTLLIEGRTDENPEDESWEADLPPMPKTTDDFNDPTPSVAAPPSILNWREVRSAQGWQVGSPNIDQRRNPRKSPAVHRQEKYKVEFSDEAPLLAQDSMRGIQMNPNIHENGEPSGQSNWFDQSSIQGSVGYDWQPSPGASIEDYHDWGPLKKFHYFNQTNGDIGIGHERVMFAPFEIETSQPANNLRLKMMSAYNLQTPDRATYLWSKIGSGGPAQPLGSVDYQNYDAIYEAGGGRFSLVTNVPLRAMHSQGNISGSGIGNISLAPKTVIIDGADWQVTQIFRTYLPTGDPQRGVSNGMTSLEPGLLVHYRWSPRTYIHGQTKYWIPLKGTPGATGNVWNYGLGISHVLHETDSFAIIPVFEAVGWSVAGGTYTFASIPTTAPASTSFVNIQPGVRFVIGPKGDLGLYELGVSGGFATNATGWYQEQLTIEMRWSW